MWRVMSRHVHHRRGERIQVLRWFQEAGMGVFLVERAHAFGGLEQSGVLWVKGSVISSLGCC